MESFESKLRRVGYKLNASNVYSNEQIIDANLNELVIKITRTKLVMSILLALFGIILMFNILDFFDYLMTEINGIEFDGSIKVMLAKLTLGIFGITCFYRGLFRFFEFRGFQVKISDAAIIVKKSKEIKLMQFEINNPTELSCDLIGDEVVISCLDQNSNRRQIFREKNSIDDCLPILQELTNEIEKRMKSKTLT